jgi:hypothetical protein
MPQTPIQILRCLALGRYTAAVEDGELEIRGPQPLASPLPASIDARRGELVAFLEEHYGGTWPAAPGSGVSKEDASPTPSKSRDARVREWLQKPREERARELRQRLRESRERRAA